MLLFKPIRRFCCICLLLAASALPALAFSQDNDTQASTAIDEGYNLVNNRFIDLVGDVDGFFGGIEERDKNNRSWARLRLGVTSFEDESVDVRGNVKLKLVLPNTEKRLQLLLSTEDEDNLDPGDAGTAGLSTDVEENISLALRFLQSVRTRSRSSFKLDLGARVRDDTGQAFLRFNASRRFIEPDEGEQREFVLINNLWYFNESGYENRLRLIYRQPLETAHVDFIQSVSELVWRENERGARFVQVYGAFRQLNDQTYLGLESIVDATTSPDEDAEHLRAVELRLRYRQNVLRPWFYYEVLPRVRWEEEQDYSERFGIELRVEAFLGSFNSNGKF